MKHFHKILLLFPLIFFYGCATFGKIESGSLAGVPKTVFVSEFLTGYEPGYIGSVKRVLEKYSYKIVNDREESSFYLDFAIEAGFCVTVRIELMRNGVSVIRVSSTNTGWGTLIARPVAVEGRVVNALRKFEILLKKRDQRY